MSATLAFNAAPSGGYKASSTVTVTAAGHAATTAYIATITTPHGGTITIPFTTSGAGGATFTFVPMVAGAHTVTSALATPATVATATINTGGFG